MFSYDSHIIPVMTSIYSIGPSFDKEVQLTPCFPTKEFRWSQRFVIDVSGFGQILVLKAWQPVLDSMSSRWIREICLSTINMAMFHSFVDFLALLGPFISLKIFCEESLYVPICTILDLIESDNSKSLFVCSSLCIEAEEYITGVRWNESGTL